LETVRHLYSRLVRYRFGREDGLIALGGGVVGDTAGFVAATYLRGIELIQVPTTLLAQIDSSIGAKVGVNLPEGKNLIGAFYRPSAVWIDPDMLLTLPSREIRSGLFELLKYGFISSPTLFRRMERTPKAFGPKSPELERAMALAVRAKLAVVRDDEREGGARRILNFGHTIGHGLEAAGAYQRLTHGEAVGWGMIAAVWLARRRGLLDPGLAERMETTVRAVAPLPSLRRFQTGPILRAIDKDKKKGAKGFRFVLPVGLGKVEVFEGFPREEISWAVRQLIQGKS
jgi:3-dehydroquinate synthase